MTKKNDFLSVSAPINLEQEEHLTAKRLASLVVNKSVTVDGVNRPKENFVDLMSWAKEKFTPFLQDQKNVSSFVHNRIIIDGQFMQFCEANKVSIEVLHRDSIVSWKTESDFEKFFVQGVFLVKSKGVEFIHAALFHKGNQYEDEISFFVLVSQDNYEAYLKLRNEFDAWIVQRDRSNLHIRVVEGDDIPYTRDHNWDNLFLPQPIKDELKLLVEGFLSSKEFYNNNNIPWKRGILMYGEPGNGKTSIIRTIISQYNFKPVTIVPGANDEAVREAFAYAEEQSPSLLYFEDLDSLLEKSVDISSFLNLMDGISAKNGLLVVATANNVKKLKTNITDRPSRFDRKFEIPLPDQQMSYLYLKKWFGSLLTAAKAKELAKYAVQYKFSYAYLKELYISAMFESLANNRKVPTEKDISKALDRLMKDKNILRSGKTVKTDKYFTK